MKYKESHYNTMPCTRDHEGPKPHPISTIKTKRKKHTSKKNTQLERKTEKKKGSTPETTLIISIEALIEKSNAIVLRPETKCKNQNILQFGSQNRKYAELQCHHQPIPLQPIPTFTPINFPPLKSERTAQSPCSV